MAGLRTKLLEIDSKAKADLLEQKSSVCNKVSSLELDRNIKTSELNWKKLIGNANTALMMKGKIAIIDGLQKFYGVSYPIFVDCAAELDNNSLAGIKADAQLIFLKVAEGDMTVTEI